MDIKCGTIKNINKKLIVGALVFTFTFSSMVGYVASRTIESNHDKYENFEGIASFEKMKKCYFIGVTDNDGETKYYLAEKIEAKSKNHTSFLYLDVVSGKNVFALSNPGMFNVSDEQAIIMEVNAKEYLMQTRNKKSMYSVSDINEILEEFKDNNKIMIK